MKQILLFLSISTLSFSAFAFHDVKVISKVTEMYSVSGTSLNLKSLTYEVGTFQERDGLAVDVKTVTETSKKPAKDPFKRVTQLAFKSRGLKASAKPFVVSKKISDPECTETASEVVCATSYEFSF